MTLRRGFKAEASGYAREMRQELGLSANDPLCARKLAEHLGLEVVALSHFRSVEPEAVQYLQSVAGTAEFSAVTAAIGTKRIIIHNDGHDPKRQSANIAHEGAHALLLHPLMPLRMGSGARSHNPEYEEEAGWLGPALLVSDEAALFIAEAIAEGQMTELSACDLYRVSLPLLRMRVNGSGARIRLARRRAA